MPEASSVETYLETTTADDEVIAATEIMDTLGEQLRNSNSTTEKLHELAAAGNAISQKAADADDPTDVTDAVWDVSGEIAQIAGIGKDRIAETITDTIKTIEDESGKDSDTWGQESGVAYDRFLEDHLTEVVIQRSTDAADDPVFRWRFDQGERVETTHGTRLDYHGFFKKISSATDRRLVTRLESEDDHKHGGTDRGQDTDSIGPDDRPWGRNKDAWTQCISGLVAERSRTKTVLGPRTEAWENIQARIGAATAYRSLEDAVAQGLIYVDADKEELWIPTSVVATAVENVETSRRALQSELAERDLDSDRLSGNGISEAIRRGGNVGRFWRLDATANDVPSPEAVEETVTSGTERSAELTRDTARSESESPTETETFGRPPTEAGATADTDDDGASATGGGKA